MNVDAVQVNSTVGVDGNSYTTAISNDELTSDDFLKLMLQELKLQDPTKPVDSNQMLTTQMQMSTISTNQQLISAIQSVEKAFTQSSLADASNVIGKNIEDGNIGQSGINKAYTVRSVENLDGEIQVKAQEILYFERQIKITNADNSESLINYNSNGQILNEDGELTGDRIVLQTAGEPLLSNGELVVLDASDEEVSDHNYSLNGTANEVYANELISLPFSQITKIF